MEILDDAGVADAIAERSTPAGQMAATAFYAGFAGPDPDYGRRLARLESWGAGGADDSWRAASPWRQLNLPQIRLEPMGPERWGPASEEWVIHLNYPVGDPRAQSDAQVEADARQALGIPDLPMKIHKITRWSVEAVMASAFRVGRVPVRGRRARRQRPGRAGRRDPRV